MEPMPVDPPDQTRRECVPCSTCTCNSAPLGDECPECGEVNETTRFGGTVVSILIVTTHPNPADRLDCHYTRIEFTSPDLRGDRYTATAGVWFPGHNDNVGGVEVPQPSPRFAMLGCWYDDEAAALAAWRCNVSARSTHHTLVDALTAPAAPTTCATDRAWECL